MPTISTSFGPIDALPSVDYFADGAVRSCIATTESPLQTPYGELIPQFTANTFRKRQLPAVSFHSNGMVRTLPLEKQMKVMTPLGIVPAELVTLYENGALKRIFPLNGALSGFWSQEDEMKLASPLSLDTPAGHIEAAVISLYFGPQGSLRSLTFWPEVRLSVPFQGTNLPVRIGLSFYDDGRLSSLEPAAPVSVNTSLGLLYAYDPDAVGITGDNNSLCFTKTGMIKSLRTVSHAFDVAQGEELPVRVEPPIRCNPCDGETREPTPLQVTFDARHVFFEAEGMKPVNARIDSVTASRFHLPFQTLSPTCTMGSSPM